MQHIELFVVGMLLAQDYFSVWDDRPMLQSAMLTHWWNRAHDLEWV